MIDDIETCRWVGGSSRRTVSCCAAARRRSTSVSAGPAPAPTPTSSASTAFRPTSSGWSSSSSTPAPGRCSPPDPVAYACPKRLNRVNPPPPPKKNYTFTAFPLFSPLLLSFGTYNHPRPFITGLFPCNGLWSWLFPLFFPLLLPFGTCCYTWPSQPHLTL